MIRTIAITVLTTLATLALLLWAILRGHRETYNGI
jgi:hypothetical protein